LRSEKHRDQLAAQYEQQGVHRQIDRRQLSHHLRGQIDYLAAAVVLLQVADARDHHRADRFADDAYERYLKTSYRVDGERSRVEPVGHKVAVDVGFDPDDYRRRAQRQRVG
jgi:hypothetical protein